MAPDGDPIDELRNLELDDDQESPYEEVDITALPDWWQSAIREFEAAGLGPFRPPRLADDTYKHEVVSGLEAKYGVDIDFVGIGVTYGDEWTVRVNGVQVASVGHRRTVDGFSVFEVSESELRSLVREHISDDSEQPAPE